MNPNDYWRHALKPLSLESLAEIPKICPTEFIENVYFRTLSLAYDKHASLSKSGSLLQEDKWEYVVMPLSELRPQLKTINKELNKAEYEWIFTCEGIPPIIVFDFKGKGLFLLYGEEVFAYCETMKIENIRVLFIRTLDVVINNTKEEDEKTEQV